jgi:excisionase family DNA binding protein
VSATLNLEEAAAYLHLGKAAFRALFDAGEIPGVSLNQKHAVFLRDQLDEWLRKKATEQATRRRGPVNVRRSGRHRPLPDLSAVEE